MENNLVTQKYLYILTKNILDILVNHINNIDDSHTIDNITNINIDDIFDISNAETISTENICPKNMQISVNDISLDANHKFVTEDQIDEFNNKASKEELDKLVSNYKSNMRQELNERFDQLLNNKNILDKLKILSRALDDDENNTLDTLLSSIIINTKDLLDEHIDGSVHLTTEDRDALNKLLKFINIGCADWNATETDPNYIRNKPESFKANGGNADTIGNCKLEDIRNRQLERIVIGHDDRASHKISDNYLTTKIIEDIYSIDNGIIGFTEGAFRISSVFNPKAKDIGELIFKGCGKGTVLNIETFTTSENITLENLTLYNCKITVNTKTIFRNVNFINCDITFSNECKFIKIIDCDFDNCNFYFNGSLFNSIIKDNIFKSTEFKYIGDSNIVKNNIFC